jgi:hypothetical protein
MRLMTQDRWTALVCLAFAAFVIVTMPAQTSDRAIPGARGFDLLDGAFFPKIAVALFAIASIWLFVAGRPAQPQEDAAEPPGLTPRDFVYACALTLGVLAYVWLLPAAGYLASTILAVAVLAVICGQRSWLGLLIGAVIFPVVVYYLFAGLFMVPLPRADFW